MDQSFPISFEKFVPRFEADRRSIRSRVAVGKKILVFLLRRGRDCRACPMKIESKRCFILLFVYLSFSLFFKKSSYFLEKKNSSLKDYRVHQFYDWKKNSISGTLEERKREKEEESKPELIAGLKKVWEVLVWEIWKASNGCGTTFRLVERFGIQGKWGAKPRRESNEGKERRISFVCPGGRDLNWKQEKKATNSTNSKRKVSSFLISRGAHCFWITRNISFFLYSQSNVIRENS